MSKQRGSGWRLGALKRRTVAGLAVAVVTVAGSAITFVAKASADDVPLDKPDRKSLADGMYHNILDVELPPATPTDVVLDASATSVELTPEDIAGLAGSRLTVDADGTVRAVREGKPAPVAQVDPLQQRIDELLAVNGIHEVTRVTPTSVAVASSLMPGELAELPGVKAVRQDAVADVAAGVDPLYPSQWGLNNPGGLRTYDGYSSVAGADIGVEQAWTRSRGAGVVIAVADSAIDVRHPDLAPNIWRNSDEICGNGVDDDSNRYVDDCAGWDFEANNSTPWDAGDTASHGTHVAGIAAAVSGNGVGIAGVAPQAQIMPLKLSSSNSMRISAVSASIIYAADNGADVINLSLSTSAPLSALPDLDYAASYARSKGMLIVAAASNDSQDNEVVPHYPASLPQDNVIAVAASGPRDEHASYSNWGRTSVDLFAPGSDIASTLPNSSYGGKFGTSMAAPMVAGAAALVKAASPDMSFLDVRNTLFTTVDPGAAFTGKVVTGGRLDVGRAVSRAGDAVDYSFTGWHSARAAEPFTASIRGTLTDPAVLEGADEVSYRLSLGYVDGGVTAAVTEFPLAFRRGGVSGEGLTDGAGSLVVGDPLPVAALTGPGDTVEVAAALPAGQYVLAVEALDPHGNPLGRPSAITFFVANPAAPAPTPTPSSSTQPQPQPTSSAAPTPPGTAPAPQPSTTSAPLPTSAPAPTSPAPAPWNPWQPAPQPSTSSSPAPAPTSGPWTPWTPWTPPPAPTQPAPAPSSNPAPQPAPTYTPPPGYEPPTGGLPAPAPSHSTAPAPAPTSAPQPAPTSSPAPVPGAPTPVTGSRFGVTIVTPGSGALTGGNLVSIYGSSIPVGTAVLVAGVRATVVLDAAPTRVTFIAPGVNEPGPRDITLVSRTNVVDILADAYTYLAPAGPPPPAATPPPSTAPAPAPGPSTPPSTQPAPAPAPTSPAPGTWERNGLTLARPAAGSVLAAFPLVMSGPLGCRTSPCAGIVL